jgi:hypothetical protein
MLDKIFSLMTTIVNFILGLFGKEKMDDAAAPAPASAPAPESPLTKAKKSDDFAAGE